MGAALMSLVGLFVSAYLYLYKIGRIGTLACGSGGCETVQASPWSRIAGVEVALVGVVGYAALLLVALMALQPALATRRWPPTLLLVLASLGLLFTMYLTSLELLVIRAICRWCVGSAAIITSIFVLALLDFRRGGPGRTAVPVGPEPHSAR
ncbi:MAG TPA: vitamin K epoxide reductase family protein [Gemmatimonadales bacterium]